MPENDPESIVMFPVPIKDLQSMARFIAHGVVANQNRVVELSHEIVSGDLSKQDKLVDDYIYALGIENWVLIYSSPEALELCDELAEKIYEEIQIVLMNFCDKFDFFFKN